MAEDSPEPSKSGEQPSGGAIRIVKRSFLLGANRHIQSAQKGPVTRRCQISLTVYDLPRRVQTSVADKVKTITQFLTIS